MNEQDDPGSSKHSNGIAMPSTSREISADMYNLSVDEALSRLLAPLRLDRLRLNPPDDCELMALHEQLTQVISNESDGQRRRKLSKANPQINFVRQQVLALIRVRLSKNRDSPIDSKNLTTVNISRLIETLDAIVSESFDEEFRKVATLLGVVDVVAELLVLEIDVYRSEIQENQAQHRSVRKLIANALTNLTFGNAASKRRLCEHEGFVDTLVTILTQQSTLVQVYAGLIRNVSWMADPTMCRLLAPTCRAVAKAFVAAYYRAHAMSTGTTDNHREPKDREMSAASSTHREMSAVSATLSALWNLASHSMENKQSICETSYCLTYLTWILTLDTKSTVLVESASGVLKYSSQYLSASDRFHQVRYSLLVSLIRMLHASSFTVVSNTLSAIDSLIGHDAKLQNWLRLNQPAFAQLNILRNSAREDIRALVKRVLNHLNNAAMYTSQQYTPVEMSSSMGGDILHSSRYTDANRLLTLRSSRASPGAQLNNLSPGSLYHRSSSLPRHFQTNHRVLGTHGHQMPLLMQTSDRPIYQPSVQSDSHTSQESGVVIGDENVSGDAELMEEISDSLRNSRAPSEQSLTSMLPPGNISSGWESVVDTTNNSGRDSPVSESELPDSPTMCANLPEFNAFANMSAPLLHSLPPIGALHISTPSSSRQKPPSKTGSRYTTTSASDATSVPSEGPTPSYPPQPTTQNSQSDDDILPGPIDENEGDYGAFQCDTGLLEKSIEIALPPPRRTEISERNPPLLSAAIESALPQRPPPVSLPPRIPNSQGLLDAAILSAMPSASPFSSHQMSTGSKNVQTGDRHSFQQPPRSPVTQKGLNSSWLQQKDDHFDSFSSSINGFESGMGQYNDEENSSATDSSSEIEPVTEVIIDLPSDVLEEVAASIKQENEKKSSIGKNARPIPPAPSTIAAKISKLRPPATTRKLPNGALTKVAATVSPFNHKIDGKTGKPTATTEKEIQNGKRKQMPPSSNQMLVTTV